MRKDLTLAACATAVLVLIAAPARAQQFDLRATLSGGGEVPDKVLTGAFGDATCVADWGARTVNCTVNVFNLPSGATGAHIHVGAEGVAGPVVCNAGVTPNLSNDFGFSFMCAASNLALREDFGIRSIDDFLQAVLGGNTYVNVHSRVNPAGEIRGQIVPK